MQVTELECPSRSPVCCQEEVLQSRASRSSPPNGENGEQWGDGAD